MRNLKCAIFVVALMLASTEALHASTIYAVGSGWQQFTWNNGPNVFNNEGPFTFTSPVAVELDVTDFRYDGDRFTVFDNGSPIGSTSVPVDNSFSIGDNADAAFVDPRFSHGTFLLAPGAHSLTFETIQSAYCLPDGTANFRGLAVPVPTSVWAGGVLLVGLAIARRRSRAAV